MISHLRSALPEYVQHMADPDLRTFIQQVISRAESLSIMEEYDVCLYLNVAAVFGAGFDGLPWAQEVLCDPLCSARARVEKVYDLAVRREASGEHGDVARTP